MKLANFVIFFLIAQFLVGCLSVEQKKEVPEKRNRIPFIAFPVHFENEVTVYEDDLLSRPTYYSNLEPYYYGELKDSVVLKEYFPPPAEVITPEVREYIKERDHIFNTYYTREGSGLNYSNFLDIDEAKIYLQIDDKTVINTSFPLAITNLDSVAAFIGSSLLIPVHVEAEDLLKQWKIIQGPMLFMCGTGVASLFLPPGESVITLVPVSKGNYFTRLRVRLGNNYSNLYYGNIDYRNFKEAESREWF